MNKTIICVILALFVSRIGYGQSAYTLPVDIEISEDAINLFLLKQYNDLGNATSATYNYQGVDFTAELLPLTIDLKNDLAATYLGFAARVSWDNSSVEVSFTYNISFDFSGIDELSTTIIIEDVRSGIQNNSLPDPVKNFVLGAFDNLNLQAYPDALVERLNQDPVIEEHPIEFTSFSDVFEVNEDALNITVTFDLLAEEPMMELMLTANNEIRCRLNFKAEFKGAILTYGNNYFYSEETFANYGTEYTFSPVTIAQIESGVIHAVNSKNAYKAYFSLSSLVPGVWIQPDKFY
ncbi:hypothetical protein [Reichenbachiella sp.]|uniref:hypothetical protein n=1 Tax=Reichenbachiella sp. TaxID=2184521 RepID=UPI003296CA8F